MDRSPRAEKRMQDLLAARAQIGMSLAFHIVFACVGVAMPLLMAIAEWRYLRTGDEVYYTLARRWAVGTAIMFAVGAVSGTVLSFELGLLWPQFMRWAGPIIGMPFSLEGFAFFTEAVFLGIYMYGWHRVSPRAHLAAGVLVALSGMASAVFVVIANSWMNTPVGFKIVHGKPVDIDPLAALTNPAAFHETIHMTIAAYAATGFAVAGIHAFMLLRDRRNLYHRKALAIAFGVGALASLAQPLSGDLAAREVARLQPIKMAAFEGLFESRRGAPLAIAGIPDVKTRSLRYAIELPEHAQPDDVSRLACTRARPRFVSSKRLAKSANRGASGLPSYGRRRLCDGGAGSLGRVVTVAAGYHLRLSLVSSRGGGSVAARDYRGRGRLDRDGSGPTALDHLWRYENCGRSYANARIGRNICPVRSSLHLPRSHSHLPALAAGDAEPQTRGGRRTCGGGPLMNSLSLLFVAGVLLISLTLYVLTGGADYGGGVWDLLATGRRKLKQRQFITESIGPIWEADHVWLILVVVILFTGFPAAFAAIMTALNVPVTLMLVGIVLRGSAFSFRSYVVRAMRTRAVSGAEFSGLPG